MKPVLNLGAWRHLTGAARGRALEITGTTWHTQPAQYRCLPQFRRAR